MWFQLPPPNSLRSIRACAAAAALSGLAACVTDPGKPRNYFRMEASPALVNYSRVAIRLDDTTGRTLATLYNDTLPTLSRLDKLNAGPYQGGTVKISIEAFRATRLAYREVRLYDGFNQKVLSIDIFRDDGTSIPEPILPVKALNQPPAFASFPRDTTVSIRDTVPLPSEAVDVDGDLAGFEWDCGDGKTKDAASLAGARARIRFGVRFAEPGDRTCVLKVRDLQGRESQAKVTVKVLLDPPWADAGPDTTVAVETPILLHARGEDGYGPIVSREWSIAGAAFKPVTQLESTFPAPKDPGELVFVLKVTDSDGLTAFDTLRVRTVLNSDNALAELKINVGRLEPAFRPEVRDYSVNLGAADSVLMIVPRVRESHATAQIRVPALPDGRFESGAVPVAAGDNFFSVRVTAQDGSTLQYSIVAKRAGTP